jgi:probable O-glycosylation ligase (exosortase A-associated)
VAKLGLMLFVLAAAAVGGLAYAPVLPALAYHGFAVLRPQYIWHDALPDGIPWSLAAAALAIPAALVFRMGYWVAPHRYPGLVLPGFNAGHLILGLFAFWISLTYLNAERPDVANAVYSDYRKIFLMFFVTCLVMVTVRQVWALFLVATASLMYIALEINEIYLLNGRYNFLAFRGFADLDNNGAGLMLAMGFPLCVYAWDGIRHWVRWLFPVGALLIGHAVMLSYSRGAMLSLLITSPLYALRCQNRKAVFGAYLVAAALVPVLAGEEISKRFMSIGAHESDGSANSRKTTWGIAARMAMERPLLGYGPRNSSLHTHRYGADEEGRVIHSTYLQIAADGGFVSLGLYVAFLGAGVYYANRVRRAVRADAAVGDVTARRAYAAACGIEGAVLVFMAGCTFLSLETFEPPYILAMAGIQLWAIVKLRRPGVTGHP